METLNANRQALLGPSSRVHLRLVSDYGLEGLVAQSNEESSWVIIVPDGEYRPGGSWKSFFFEHFHCSPAGGHRSAERTFEMMRRCVYWLSMQADIAAAVELCWVCLQFRKRPAQLLSRPFAAWASLPWQHVLIDFEGPKTPPDLQGYRYIFT